MAFIMEREGIDLENFKGIETCGTKVWKHGNRLVQGTRNSIADYEIIILL